MKTQDFL